MPSPMPSPTPHRSWRDALAIYLRAPVITMLFLGFSAGLPFLLVFSTLSAWLRSDGVEVAAIGFFSWIGILYSIKFFWAPVVDRLALPLLTRTFGQRRGWMLLAQAMIATGLVGLASLDPVGNLAMVGALRCWWPSARPPRTSPSMPFASSRRRMTSRRPWPPPTSSAIAAACWPPAPGPCTWRHGSPGRRPT